MFEVGQKVIVNAKRGTILAIETGKRGKILYTVQMADRVIKTQQVDAPIVFEAPASWAQLVADHTAENRASRIRNGSL